MKYRETELKLLWGKAAGRCSFPHCPNELIVHSTNDIIGQMAHIVAKSDIGPRGNPNYPKERLHTYENLILLCPHHHALVDGDESTFTIERLKEIKEQHEKWVRDVFSVGTAWRCNVSQVYYLNVPRLSILAGMHGFDINWSFLEDIPNLHSLGARLATLLLQFRGLLDKMQLRSLPMAKLKLTTTEEIGVTVSFKDYFRTKNVPGLDDYMSKGFNLTSNLKHDPQIYKSHLDFKFILPIDPQWITTTTGFGNLRPSGGKGFYAGLCTIKEIDFDNKVVIATPIVFGSPISVLDRLFDDIDNIPRTLDAEDM